MLALLVRLFWCAVWGAFRALFSCCSRRSKAPDLSADVCVVTGAGQGLGRQIALALAAECGATLVLWDIDEEKVRSVASEIREGGRNAHSYVVDCSKREDVYRVAAQVREEVGDVAVLVNNAGVLLDGPGGYVGGGLSDEQIVKTFSVNTLTLFWTVRAFLPWMMENDYGYIVNVSSPSAHVGYPYITAYSATKASVRSFSESLRYELLHNRKKGISVTCVYPGIMNTAMVDSAVQEAVKEKRIPILRPEDVARVIITRGIGGKERDVFISSSDGIMPFLKAVLPREAIDMIAHEMGELLMKISKKTE